MDYKRSSKEIVIRLDEDDEIIESVAAVCSKENIESAFLAGIGAVKKAEIAHFDTSKNEYASKTFEGMFEIVSMSGNVSMLEGKQTAHIHIVLGKKDFAAVGGHLLNAVVNPTCEIVVLPLENKIAREKDKKTGLNLQKL